ncbi:MAG TPA: alpha/beta fold hydrolase [Spirochaetota bacterium]|nr:alpha/beta fold hydrolase [Spirochaetota bacterium]HPJ38358.1 alpha/beta fold hydrolase [Spirochaetota bacterium]HPQ53503.1 alpha/beta fold hydrolase [Spirochaetota bacterium]
MTRKISAILLALFLAVPAVVFAGSSSSNTCDTRYPIVLAHGMGASAEILGIMDYWWGIEDPMEDEGADVYITSVNGMDSTANKAASFRAQFLQILAIAGASKGNIIGHSHGTVYTRYALTNLGLGSKVASHTSLSGPHRGSSVADTIFNIVPECGWELTGATLDFVYAFIFGDTNPNSLENGLEMTRPHMQNIFNPNCPNVSGVYYQSWTSKIRYASNSVILEIPWLICKYYEGDNDGLVSVTSAKWGNFRGVIEGSWWSGGVDHLNIVGQLFGVTPGFDAPGFFVSIAQDLKARGY